jgi:ribonuclease Z
MLKAHIGFRRDMIILVSHIHGDHVLGIPGLLQTMSLLRREKLLHIFGPEGLIDYIKTSSETFGGPAFPVILHEIQSPGVIHEENRFQIITVPAQHKVLAWSYGFLENPRPGRFYPEKARDLGVPEGPLWHQLQHGQTIKEKGKVIEPSQVTDSPRQGRKIIYSGDTRPSEELKKLAEDADLLIHEATFLHDLKKRAIEDGHTTVLEAAELAKEAGVKKLALTHISSRYPSPAQILDEAMPIFENTILAQDLMELEIPLP